MKKIAVLGSTGSIGTQTLDIVRQNCDKLRVCSLVAFSNEAKLNIQAAEFSPNYTALILRDGQRSLIEAVNDADIAVIATRGITAIECILYCLDNGIDVALANKEALVCAGELIKKRTAGNKAKLFPIDSEHCAINQCLLGHSKANVSKILLTASGGPFWQMPVEELKNVTAKQALKHPNWQMGSKITIDSATMMNKSLEVIEASFLFDIPVELIKIIVHRQSIVHSMVQFENGEIVAQLASPDMRLPIQIALLSQNGNFSSKDVDFTNLNLSFEQCDFEKFPCSKLGYKIMRYPPLCRTVLNAANDVCVDRFLQGKFSFVQFYNIIMKAVNHFCADAFNSELTTDNIIRFDAETKKYVNRISDGK